MNFWEELTLQEILHYKVIHFGSIQIRVESILFLLIFIIVSHLFLRFVKKIINRITTLDEAKKYSIFSLFKYFYITICIVLGLQILGFNITLIVAGSAALLVGLGLGIQNLFSDYISGIIVLFDSSIKVGDIIEVDGLVCQVKEIKLRTSLVLTRDDKYIIIPNSNLTKNSIINWTHYGSAARFEVTVGVAYGSDVALVKRLLTEATIENKNTLTSPKPFVRFTDFGESSLNFSVFFWTPEVFRVENIKGEIRESIHEKFKNNRIEIPFPQRVIHQRP